MDSEIIERIKKNLKDFCRDYTRLDSPERQKITAIIQELEGILDHHKQPSLPEHPSLSEAPASKFSKYLGVISILFLVVFTALLFFSKPLSLSQLSLSQLIIQLARQKPEWLWLKVPLMYISIVTMSSIFVLLWNRKLRFWITPLLFFIILIPVVFAFLMVFWSGGIQVQNRETEILFPEAATLGGINIQTYGTNATVKYLLSEETLLDGPDGYAQITLKPHSLDHNCGWIISFSLEGIDIYRKKYKQLRFQIKGENGDEKIGVKAKDAYGKEIAINLEDDHYLRTGKISTKWQQVSIPFEHFGKVDFSFMANFSLFTDGNMTKTIPQTIYVGGFELK